MSSDRQTRPVVSALEVVLGLVGGDAREPGLQIVLRHGVDVGVCGDKGVLREVLRLVVVAHELVADGKTCFSYCSSIS